MTNLKLLIMGIIAAFPFKLTYGEEITERIEYNSNTGNYIVWYEYMGVMEHTTIIPPTKFLSHISTSIELKSDVPEYTYRISNDKTSEQPIETINIDVNSKQFFTSGLPSNWKSIEANDARNSDLIHAGFAYWGDEEVGGLTQGKTIILTITANSLPGVGAIRMRGSTPIIRYAGEGVGPELEDELNSITHGDKSYVTTYAVMPCIPLSYPLVTSDILMNIKEHIQSLSNMQLIDVTLNSKLSGYLQSAADASLHNNTDGFMRNLGMIESAVMSYNGNRMDSSSTSSDIIAALRKAITFNLHYIRVNDSQLNESAAMH